MNEVLSKFLLMGDKFMSEVDLKQPGFTYSACSPFAKKKERIQKFMQTRNADYIYKNDLDKTCFQHDIAYVRCKDLDERTADLQVLNKMSDSSCVTLLVNKSAIKSMSNQLQLANKLHKPIIRNV